MTFDAVPFVDCHGVLALTQEGELVRLVAWLRTEYWGERVFEVEDTQGFRQALREQTLIPVDVEMLYHSHELPPHWGAPCFLTTTCLGQML